MAVYGWDIQRSGLSRHLFCVISPVMRDGGGAAVPSFLKGVRVVGRVVSSSISATANQESALEGMGAESSFSATAALAQSGSFADITQGQVGNVLTGQTIIGVNESLQVWRGEEPISPSIVLDFTAFSSTAKEVEVPIQLLHMFKSPNLGQGVLQSVSNIASGASNSNVLGDVPFDVDVSIFNKRFNASYVLESVNEDEDEIRRDKTGGRLSQQVSLTLKASRALQRGSSFGNSDIKVFGYGG